MILIGPLNLGRRLPIILGQHGLLMVYIISTSKPAVPGNMETKQCKDNLILNLI